jgi:tRNA pseudouridine32 synthase/23S rRNA pseudouridine746 synthase
MAISRYCSKLVLPHAQPPYPDLVDFLADYFPHVSAQEWARRVADGKVLDKHEQPLDRHGYQPQQVIYYYREVAEQPIIPFAENILYQDDALLVACKPHFLPVHPGGRYVTENLVYRLRQATGNDQLAPVHRIDRFTAGLVLFAQRAEDRARYNALFSQGQVKKRYDAVAHCKSEPQQCHWQVSNRIVQGDPWFCWQAVAGDVNARSHIDLLNYRDGYGLFSLQPITGKTHQLRLHMSGLGFGLVNDRYYPELLAEQSDDFSAPLQLLAKEIAFTDPVTGKNHHFESPRTLEKAF